MKKEFKLDWGCPIIVRQALVETLGKNFPTLLNSSLMDMGYPPHFGKPRLIKQLKDMAERQSGHRPKHLVVTCGATGAIHAALYALKTSVKKFVVISKRYYPLYPTIINVAGYHMIVGPHPKSSGCLTLVDSPSNPEGAVYPFASTDAWDSAYASKTYSRDGHVPENYRVMCGSVSKTLGLAGLRLGWASTNSDELIHYLNEYVTSSYIGLSTVSMDIAENVLDILDQDKFEARASGYLDSNREEMQKLLTKFGQGDVPSRGMFCVLQLGKVESNALKRAGIKWLPGTLWGEDDSWARLSLGQTREVTRAAVKAALK